MIQLTKYKFDELYDIDSGVSTTPDQAGHGYPFASFSTIFNNIILPDELPDLMNTTCQQRKECSIKSGDILITRTSETLDELAMSSVAIKDYPNATFSGFAKRLRPKTNLVYPKYIAFYLRSPYFRKVINSNAIMTLRASFNSAIFSYLFLYLPDYETQVKLGDFLYSIERKISLCKKSIKTIDKIATLEFEHYFRQFDFTYLNKPYKTAGFETKYDNTLHTDVPTIYKVEKIGDHVTTATGNQYANYGKDKGKYRFFSCSRSIQYCDDYEFDGNLIIVATHGDFHAEFFSGKINAYSCNTILTPKNNKYYGLLYFTIREYLPYLKKQSNGSIIKFIGNDDILNIPFINPNDDFMLEKFSNYLFLMQKNQTEIETLVELKDFLIQKIINGQVTFKDDKGV